MPDWYRTHSAGPDAYPEREYLDWAQDAGLRVDAAGNVTDPAEDPPPADGWASRPDGTLYWAGGQYRGPLPGELDDDDNHDNGGSQCPF